MPTEKRSFPGHSGARLSARLDLPDGKPLATALFAHCFTCGKDIAAAREIARGLTAEGFAVLRFDFTGLGSSEGEFAHAGFSANVGDLVAAAEYLAAEGMAPALLVGHSLGGAAVLAAAGRIPSARAVATIAAPADPAHALHLFGDALERIHEEGEAEVSLGGRPFTVSRGFVEDLSDHRLRRRWAALRLPLMILHAPRDQT
jgi:alpha/beta superfamily hydrolase